MNFSLAGIVVVVLIVVVIVWLYYRHHNPVCGRDSPCPPPTNLYQYLPGKNILGDDIGYYPNLAGNIPALETACNGMMNCFSFTSSGHLKYSADPSKIVSCPDLYIKTNINPASTYSFYPMSDVVGQNISYLPNLAGNIPALEQMCNSNSMCVAFTDKGYLKSANAPIVNQDGVSLYVKNS